MLPFSEKLTAGIITCSYFIVLIYKVSLLRERVGSFLGPHYRVCVKCGLMRYNILFSVKL